MKTGRRRACGVSTESAAERSEAESTADCRSNVIVVKIGNAGTMRNGDGQAAGHIGTRNSGKSVEALGEMMIYIERSLVEGARLLFLLCESSR